MTGATTTNDGPAAAAGMRGYRYKHGDRPLAGYTIQRAAGRGGFGEVYYALSDSGREVALKVVHAYEEVELRGIGQCMNLKSPHLVSIFDVRYADDGQPVVIMEYVSGPSLRELLDEAPAGFGPQKAAFFLREIGKGLTYLHDCGIVHRDLKPANIFYENGYVKIGDYGLSKVISASHRSGQTVTVGTLHYMAPEVGAGRYDRGIDIYALGALLYEMMTGQPPFFGISPAEVLMKHISAQVNVDGIEEPFATVIKRALAKDPNERYQTVQEMVEAVFGSEHVRQSVSVFSPADLTVIAGRVAQQAGLRPGGAAHAPAPLSSRAFEINPAPAPAGKCGWFSRRLAHRGRCLVARAATVGRGIGSHLPGLRRRHGWGTEGPAIQPRPVEPPPLPPPPPVPAEDPLSTAHRVVLGVIAAVAVAVAAGAFADGRNPFISGVFALLGIVGATVGVRLMGALVLPALQGESKFLQHLAAGGAAGVLVIAVALPAWVPAASIPSRHAFHVGGTLAAICVSLLIVDWAKRTAASRTERVSLGHLLTAGMVAVIVSGVLNGAAEVVIAVLCGTCIAAQIVSPWYPAGGQRTPPDVAPQAAVAPGRVWPFRPEQPVGGANVDHPVSSPAAPPVQHRPFELPTVYDVARRSVAVGKAAVVWPIRAALFLVSAALVLATLLVALGVAFDLPGLLASGRIDPRLPQDIRAGMGVDNWPLVLRSMGVGGLFVLACVAVTLLMWLRRSSGGVHMLRAVLGTALLLWAPFVIAGAGIDWAAAGGGRFENGWQFWQSFVRGVTPAVAVRAAGLLVAGVLLLLWPAGRKGPRVAQPQAAPAPESSTPAKAQA